MRIQPKLVLAVAALLPALVACPPSTPPDPVVPKSAKVKAFTASPTEVEARGDTTVLSWDVEDATSVQLATLWGEVIPLSDPTRQRGTVEVTVQKSTVYVLTARGEGGKDTAAVSVLAPGEPEGIVFEAFPPRVHAGEPVTLVWNTRVGGVNISDGGSMIFTSLASQGAFTVTPSFDTTWTLQSGDRSAQASVEVSPAILAFASTPRAAQPGQSVTLSWKAGGASKVTLRSGNRGVLGTWDTAAEISDGSFTETLPSDVFANTPVPYVLEAEHDGELTRRELTVWVGTQPVFDDAIIPEFAKENTPFTVGWRTRHADRLQVAVEGKVVYQATTAALTETGTVELPAIAPGDSVQVELRAHNAATGAVAVESRTVAAVGVPALVDFSANVSTVAHGGEPITLSWNVTNARHVKLREVGGRTVKEVLGVSAETGTVLVYPNGPMTYELEANNTVGDPLAPSPALSVDVTTPARLTWSASGVPEGAPVTVTGHTVVGGGDILGLPTVGKNLPGDAFIDVTGMGEEFEPMPAWLEGPVLATFGQPFDSSVFGVHAQQPTLSIHPNGWMVFSTSEQWGDADNTTPWPGPGLVPLAIAPYFDDLQAKPDGSSRIWVHDQGTGLDRRVIVQWTDLESVAHPGSTLTFQAQLYGTGRIVFAYGKLQGAVGNVPSVGVLDRSGNDGLVPQELPAVGDTFSFFHPVASPVQLTATVDPYFVRVRIGTSDYLELSDAPDTLPRGLFEVTEVNANPTVADGQWFEVRNRSSDPIDLTGWSIDFGGGNVHALSGTVVLPANGLMLFGQTATAGDGLGVDYVYGTGFTMSAGQSVGFTILGGTYTALQLPPASLPAGYTWHLGPAAMGMISAPVAAPESACLAAPSSTYGTHGQRGTPGAANTSCPNLAAPVAIPGAFESIELTGTRVALVSWDPTLLPPEDEGIATITLPTPVIIDGLPVSQLVVGSNGFISFDPTLTCNEPDWCFYVNKPEPTPNLLPRGVLAPFWMDLDAPAGGVFWERKVPGVTPNDGYTIVSWEHYNRLSTPDDLNFQVKFFDTGIVEIHFGLMQGVDGTGSTTWWENATGSAAFVINVDSNNNPGVQSNTGWRFSPL